MLRIISGKYRHLNIKQPKTTNTRPTMDRVREAIFSSIRFNLEGSCILDLFAGSGAYSFEALSNFAAKSVAIDNNSEAINTIKENALMLKIENIEIIKDDVLNFLNTKIGRTFDFIFIDAPYNEYELVNKCLELICNHKFLTRNGLIILETDNHLRINIPDKLTIQKQKKYGRVDILFIANNN
ncbi:16S rRNA (guanine(966)-N(2))-methyltransferase RsmD [Mycoplasmopsis caviae]|uniref:16S rRNA (Guanine(966)-N(2))-methyltransferase RsmD n=1 Tax=Mycoplasmopsis caviae TaxID=55603 RepID=A0A3P8MDG1_9BACT|nr:16S rRNA (guanine(966)-N(2))-methyltransferase RsmD [Mycoplasmopsis caviae]UUD35443.1 16S rRNA (guanine(966)-N(2))-methyltransferase RsmD [Mycoplasmopsis caviae]VDR41780.1 N6-adenine-specific methylase [Mycoplasmopsis caviae]